MSDFNQKPYAVTFSPESIALYKAGDESQPYANIVSLVTYIQYHECIEWPAYGATMVVVDNSENLISKMPLQGFEKVIFKCTDPTNEEYEYTFRVWKVANRIAADRRNIYTLCLISEEGLLNEGIRVNKLLEGSTDSVVKKVMKDYLKRTLPEENVEPAATTIKLLPTKKSPFSLIRSLCMRTVSSESYNKKNSTSAAAAASGSTESDVSSESATKASGTAGYLFYQTQRGYYFKSIDTLSDSEKIPVVNPVVNDEVQPFIYQAGKAPNESLMRIQEVVFGGEIDMMEKLRKGVYSSIVCYFNINTGKYEEYVYSLKDTWNDMVHLGSQTKLPIGQETLSEYPSRVMSTVINHESFYNGTGIASNEDSDLGDQDVDNIYPDFVKQYLSQGIARYGIMSNQELTISLTGHLELCAGDKIEIRIPNQVTDKEREEEVWDPEHSGTYLIKKLNHQFDVSTRKVYTVLDLIRDSYGIKDSESKVT